MDCFHLELAIKAQVAHPTPRRAIKKWVLFLGTLNAVVIGICPFHKRRIITPVAETVLGRLAGAQFCGKGGAPSRDVGLPQTSAVNAAAELSALLPQGLSSSITLLACQLS